MYLKLKRFCLGVLLVYTITTTTLPSAGRCEPPRAPRPSPHPVPRHVRDRGLTKRSLAYPPGPEGRGGPHLDSSVREEESRNPPDLVPLENGDAAQAGTSGARPERGLGPNMASSSSGPSLKNRHKPKQTEGGRMYSPLSPSDEDCSGGNIKPAIHGKFYIVGQLEPSVPKAGYQSDSAASAQAEGGQARTRGQRLSGSEESWQRLQPVVECGDDAMTLVVRRRRAAQLLLDRANESSVALSQLPPHCGYSVQTTWRDLSLMAQYDACHVTQEDGSYVLPLLWRGSPVRMSCPVSQMQPHAIGLSSPCCSSYGMTVKVQGPSDTEELRINVRGQWTPLELLAEQCGYILDKQDAETVIAAPYLTCGITVKDGKYTLSLQIGEKTFTLSCPVAAPEGLPLTHQPLVDSPHHLSGGPTKPVPETLEPFPWAPPFYLAPPYYPHPTYHHKYPRADVHGARNDPTPPSSTPDPAFGPQPLPPVDSLPKYPEYSHQIPVSESYKQFSVHNSLSSTDEMEDSGWVYPDLQQKQGTPVLDLLEKRSATHTPSSATEFPVQVEAPSLQPPSHAFNPYYHYYHHPKIPLPGLPQDFDPGPEVPDGPSSTNPDTREFPVLPPNLQQSDSDRFPQPPSHPHILPASPKLVHNAPAPQAPYPQPYPHHYFYYFPYIARGEAKSLASLHGDMAAKTNLSHAHPLSRSSALPVHNNYNMNPHIHRPNAYEMINAEKHRPDWIRNPLSSKDDDNVKPEHGEEKRHLTPVSQPPLPPTYPPEPDPVAVPPSSNHNLPLYPYYYHHPYYHYYQMYYRPKSLQSAGNRVSPVSSTEASNPPSFPAQLPSYQKHQTTSSPTESTYDVQNGQHPYYYYYHHLFYQPSLSKDNHELHPAASMDSEKASSKPQSQLPSDSDHSSMDLLVHAAETGNPSIPQPLHRPLPSFYSHHMTQQHPYDPFGHPAGEEEELDNEMRARLKANTYTPSASPCVLGSVSDFDCSNSLGCCSYPVKAPDFVAEPTVAPPARPSQDSNVSCTLQRLTSDPDIYIATLDGCGVNKHVLDQTVARLLEVQGIHCVQRDHSSLRERSPVRLMVECSSSPGSPGEARLHVMEQPPPPPIRSTPATVTVQLRIATDEFFTSYHPETHLPLSLLRGRPLYLEASLLNPPEPDLVLLVHSCLAYTQAPYISWMPIYDGCPSRGDSQLLPSPRSDPHHIRRLVISSFLSLPSESPSYMAEGGYSLLEDLEISFLCWTEVCSAADGDCTVGCINSPNSDV